MNKKEKSFLMLGTAELIPETPGAVLPNGKQSGIVMLHETANKCRSCRERLARLHYNHFHFISPRGNHGRGETWYYCDCECGHGTITGWYRTREEAIAAWNAGKKLDASTALVEGRKTRKDRKIAAWDDKNYFWERG